MTRIPRAEYPHRVPAQTLPGDLPEGWFAPDPERAASLLAELEREVSVGHPLHRACISVVAHREGTDDILCRHLDDPSRFTVIHLTWLGREEIDSQHPVIEADGDFDAVLAHEARFGGR
jgi:hypothetical protein